MLVCTKKEVFEYLKKERIGKLYLSVDFYDDRIESLIADINKDKEKIKTYRVNNSELDELMGHRDHEGIIAEIPDNSFILWLFLILSSLLLFFIVMGISFSMFETILKGDTPVGDIIVNYSDINGQGNGINIVNAVPITDNEGKVLTGTGNYFDFTITGSTSNIPLQYIVVLEKEKVSTLDDNMVKVYLTSLVGIEEIATNQINKYSNLEEIKIQDDIYKLLYRKKIGSNLSNFSDSYRLRLWVSDDAVNFYNKIFSVKVNVYVEGVSE